MLRIASQQPTEMPEEETMDAIPEQEAPPEEIQPTPDQMQMGCQVSPESAKYMPPDMRCQSCIHFMEPGSCEVVSGPIDPAGVCLLFVADQPDEGEQDLDASGDTAKMPEEESWKM